MKANKIIAFSLAACLSFALCACSIEDDGKAADNTTSVPASTTDATVSTEPVKDPDYIVKVVDEGGNPIVGAQVMICQGENCSLSPTDASGEAKFFDKEPADYEAKLAAVPSGYEYASEEQVFHFADGSNELTIVLKAVA